MVDFDLPILGGEGWAVGLAAIEPRDEARCGGLLIGV